MNRHQPLVFESLEEEVRFLQEQWGWRPTFNVGQQRRLALEAQTVCRRGLWRFALNRVQNCAQLRAPGGT